jgi:hypothetical protein
LTRAVAVALVLVAASCSRGGALVVVRVDAATPLPSATSLTVHAVSTLRSQSYTLPLSGGGIPPVRVFGVEVPPAIGGAFEVHVEALVGSGVSLASGDGSTTLGSGRRDISITLAPGGGGGADLSGAVDGSGPGADLFGTCVAHGDCPSLVCRDDHTCAPASDVAYVDNGGMTAANCIATGVHDGTTPATAFCSIPPALDLGRSYVRVAGSSAHYAALNASSNTWNGRVIVGPGRAAAMPATLFADGSAGPDAMQFSISMLTFDGMDFSGQVDCTNVGTLKLVDVSIHDSTADGVSLGGCVLSFVGGTVARTAYSGVRTNTSSASASLVDVTFVSTATSTVFNGAEPTPAAILHTGGGLLDVDRCYLGPNNGVGMLFGGGTYSVTNTIIADNTGSFAIIGQGGTGVFQFNTVANNKRGVNCNNNVLEASIFYNNTAGGSEFNSMNGCSLINGTITSASPTQPIFAAPGYKLNPTSTANANCCIDQVHATVDGGAAALSHHDYFGTTRPQGNGSDIGAHEAR